MNEPLTEKEWLHAKIIMFSMVVFIIGFGIGVSVQFKKLDQMKIEVQSIVCQQIYENESYTTFNKYCK